LLVTHNGLPENGVPKIDISKYPAIKEHLDSYWKQIEARADQGDTPYHLRSCAYMEDFSKPKIMWIELVDRPNFAFDKSGIMVNNTVFFITGSNLCYLIAYLNSPLCDWQFGKICATSGTGTRRWIKQYIEQIHVPLPSSEDNNLMEKLMAKINAAHGTEKSNLIAEVDKKILALFNFTPEEHDFVRTQFPRS